MTADSALAALTIQVTALKGNLSKMRGDLDAACQELITTATAISVPIAD